MFLLVTAVTELRKQQSYERYRGARSVETKHSCIYGLALDRHKYFCYLQQGVRELNYFPSKETNPLACVLKCGLVILICLFSQHMEIFKQKSQLLNFKAFQWLPLTQ